MPLRESEITKFERSEGAVPGLLKRSPSDGVKGLVPAVNAVIGLGAVNSAPEVQKPFRIKVQGEGKKMKEIQRKNQEMKT